ncbi:unnamed protein product [Nippostrongylus brasiliensis]|uniref:ZM domain-containing protein n=1 Tax=Nippostrongylus brasiliensis TaxID=27835 RepID=A0A0N4XEX3_NIPBR|nr:unnamed protein product [Nippostrongylus brasiliensis]
MLAQRAISSSTYHTDGMTSSYDHHPASETLSNVDKEVATATVSTKSTEYDDYEKKLPELKQTTVVEHLPPIIETPTTPPPATYVREITYQPYQSRPVAYRPQAFIPSTGLYRQNYVSNSSTSTPLTLRPHR